MPVLCGTNTGHHMLLDTVAGDTMELEVDNRYIYQMYPDLCRYIYIIYTIYR